MHMYMYRYTGTTIGYRYTRMYKQNSVHLVMSLCQQLPALRHRGPVAAGPPRVASARPRVGELRGSAQGLSEHRRVGRRWEWVGIR